MSADDNRTLVERTIQEINKGNAEIVDEAFADDFVSVPLWPNPVRPVSIAAGDGRDGVKAGIAMLRGALPDVSTSIEAIAADGDIVMVCTIIRGTHTGGPFFDMPATGKALQWTTFDIYRVSGGKIVEDRWLWDRLGAFQQLGVVPSQAELRQRMQATP